MGGRDVYDGDAEGCIRGNPYEFPLGEAARTGNIEAMRYQLDPAQTLTKSTAVARAHWSSRRSGIN